MKNDFYRASVVALAGAVAFSAMVGSASAQNAASIMPVRYYGYHHNYYRHHHNGWATGAGIAAGIAAGALLGGALAAQPAPRTVYSEPVYPADVFEYCSRRFKSWDPETGTYLGYDGYRHPCP